MCEYATDLRLYAVGALGGVLWGLILFGVI